MDDLRFEHLLSDVAAHYAEPRDVWNDNNLTTDQKIRALRNWEQDLRLIEVATEENMNTANPDKTAERLREVHCLLEKAGANEQGAPSPTKAGGAS